IFSNAYCRTQLCTAQEDSIKYAKSSFFTTLQMASGHHQVADALICSLEKRAPEILCKKIEFLSYVNERIEKMEQLLEEEQPDLLVCTHAFPSFLVSRLKEKQKIFTPLIKAEHCQALIDF
ncbi:hypothetical protein P9597_24605, partial [Aneurinibacillus migulanus]|uniref:MGDG synthase family glycosyltransferase n=1 Tax=Aneurinibacillus migulanus TaxID=47500 RepID=UPI002EA7C4CF|nr:hypothetical protein [Aneurinibacillus migulanus]